MAVKKKQDRKRRAQRRLLRKQLASVVPADDTEEEVTFEGPAAGTLQHRASKLSDIIVMFPQQIAMSLAAREEAHWIFGRLYLVGVISRDHLFAVSRLHKAVVNYRRLLIRYGDARISNPEREAMRVGGTKSEDLSPLAEKRLERATKEYDKQINVLKDCGSGVAEALLRSLDTDTIVDLEIVRRGLDALCRSAPYIATRRRASATT